MRGTSGFLCTKTITTSVSIEHCRSEFALNVARLPNQQMDECKRIWKQTFDVGYHKIPTIRRGYTVRSRKHETTYKKLSLNIFVFLTPDYKRRFSLPLTILFLIHGSKQ